VFLGESIGFKDILGRGGAAKKTCSMTSPNAVRMKHLRFIVGFVSLIVALQAASAAEWRYCLAASDPEHKVYFSGAFTTSADAWTTDSAFEQVLTHAGFRYDDVQCPRADDESAIMAMLKDAVAYNRTNGRKIIYVRWEPSQQH
jgi:hypothetical protein